MASEITTTISFAVTKNGASEGLSGSKSLDLSGTNMSKKTQTIGTSDSALVLSELTGVPGMLALKNKDVTNSVTLSLGTGGAFTAGSFAILRPGAVALLQPATATIYAKASASTVSLQFSACEL